LKLILIYGDKEEALLMVQTFLGRRLYYNKLTGVILFDTGERMGENIVDTTVEEDFQYALELRNQNPEIIGHIQLQPHEYSDEFAEAVSYRINPETEELEFGFKQNFDYTGFQKPYKQQISILEEENKAYQQRIADLELMIVELIIL